MSNHVGMVSREDVAGWQRNWETKASAKVCDDRLRMAINGIGEIRVTHRGMEIYFGTDIDAAIKAWDGAGDKSRLGDRETLQGLSMAAARAILRDDASVVLNSGRDEWWLATGDGTICAKNQAHVHTFGDVKDWVGYGVKVYPVLPG